jgi:hypothetical protein
MRELEKGRPEGELTKCTNTDLEKQSGFHQEETDSNPLFPLVKQKLSEALTRTPAGEDEAFWPIPVLNDINYLIVNRQYIKDNPGGAARGAFAEKAAQMRETVMRVTLAYDILVYPHCRQQSRKECIEADLTSDNHFFERDQVELSYQERAMLSKLASARNIPFDPNKRIYDYSEVIGSSNMITGGHKEPAKKPLEGVLELRGTYK